MFFEFIEKKFPFKVSKPPRPQMAKVAHSAIIIQKAFRIYKKKKLEGTLRKGVVKVNKYSEVFSRCFTMSLHLR